MSRAFKIFLAVLLGLAIGAAYLVLHERKRHMDHHKRSRSSASSTLKRVVSGARVYWAEHGALPVSGAETPPAGSCCKASTKPMCRPDVALWETPTWQALGFAIDDPNAYSYTFETSTRDGRAGFTARARGDLDCDGTLSTFEVQGRVGSDGDLTIGQSYRVRELE